jgi:hypothetical protein
VRFTSALSEALRISLSIARVIGTDFLCPPCFRTSGRQIVTDRLQQQRFEFKYRINEEKARRIREFVQAHLRMDVYSTARSDFSYPTLSLYLDSDDLDTYWHSIAGNKNRFKLRLRYYDDQPDTPVFFEIKQRVKDVILKKRGGVKKRAVRSLLAGQMPTPEDMLQPGDVDGYEAVRKFCELMLKLKAKPKMHVAYLREAYENPTDNSVRLTFDRQVKSQPSAAPLLIAKSPAPHLVFGSEVILELKFTNRFPKWFHDLVTHFDCLQEGAAKYAEGIYEKGEYWVHHACSPGKVVDSFLAAENYPGLFERTLREANTQSAHK